MATTLPVTFRASSLPSDFRGYGAVAAQVESKIGRKLDFSNHDDWRIYQNAYRAFDLEDSRKKERARYARNKDAYRARKKIWKKNNPEKVAAIKSARRALEYGRTHPEIDRKAVREIFSLARKTTVESGEPYCVDHIIPLKRGGWHHHQNLQVLPKRINCCGDKGVNAFWTSPSEKYKDWRSVPVSLWPKDLATIYSDLMDQQQESTISEEMLSS